MNTFRDIIDISQPVSHATACFPGDTPFQKTVTVAHAQNGTMNLTAFTMSPHVGTHADAPVHIRGNLDPCDEKTIGELPLDPFLGPCVVVDVSPTAAPVTVSQVQAVLAAFPDFPQRVLLKTQSQIRPEVFEAEYASISPELAQYLVDHHVKLVGLDTPSVDPVDSKTLETHHILLEGGLVWLENLDLTHAAPGAYTLVALPLKLMELEASPVRAVLLSE